MCDLPQPKLTASNVASTGKVKVSWDAVEGAVKYQLYKSTDGENFTLASTTTKTTVTHSSSEVGVQYYYKVRAIAKNSSANSAYSAVKSRTCDLARPSVSVERNSKDQPVVSWAPVSGATKYKIHIYDKDGNLLKTNNTTKTSVNHSSATAGTKYTYQVRALCDISAATSAYSAAKSIMALPSVPEMKTTAKSTDSTITISWGESELASGYDVYRRASTNDSWTKITSVTSGSTTSYTDSNVNGRYYYSIAAYITVDNTKYAGSNSGAIRARTLAKPTISVEGSEDSLQNTISWGSVKGATAYQIYCQTGDALADETSSWKRIATVEDSTSYIYDVERGVHYRYKVRAIYTYKSVTTYSPYSAVSDWYLHHEYPNFSVSMYEDSYDSVQGTLIGITNTGSSTIRFFTDGLWLDTDGGESDYDRSAKLYDYAAYAESETYIQIDYVDVAPGTTETLLVIADSLTRYHADTQIVLNMYYDGVYYVSVCNSHSPYYYITE